MLAKSSHTSVVELGDPFDEDCGFVGPQDVETGGSVSIRFIALGTVGVGKFVVLEMMLQGFNLGMESSSLAGVGLLGLADSANGSAQHSPESGDIQGGYVVEEGIQ